MSCPCPVQFNSIPTWPPPNRTSRVMWSLTVNLHFHSVSKIIAVGVLEEIPEKSNSNTTTSNKTNPGIWIKSSSSVWRPTRNSWRTFTDDPRAVYRSTYWHQWSQLVEEWRSCWVGADYTFLIKEWQTQHWTPRRKTKLDTVQGNSERGWPSPGLKQFCLKHRCCGALCVCMSVQKQCFGSGKNQQNAMKRLTWRKKKFFNSWK